MNANEKKSKNGKKDTVEVNLDARALVLMHVDNIKYESPKIASRIAELGIRTDVLAEMSGKSDIMCLLRCPSLAEIKKDVEAIKKNVKGITSIEVNVLLNVLQG